MHLKINWASLYVYYSWKEIYVSNLQHVFTKTRLEDIDLSKTQPCKYFVYVIMDWGKSNRRLRSELHKQQIIYCDTLWPQSFGTCKVLWQIQQFMSYCTAFAFFYFEFDGNQVPSTLDLGDCIWRGDLLEVFFALRFWGAYIWRGV